MAPPEVSALPEGGTLADLDASGGVALAAGGLVGVSAAKAVANPTDSTKAVEAIRRIISELLSLPASDNVSARESLAFTR